LDFYRPHGLGYTKVQQFTFGIANQVKFESVEPAQGTFTHFGQVPEYFVAFDAFVVTYGYLGGIYKGYAGTLSKTNQFQK
jgi:hypothetical protein